MRSRKVRAARCRLAWRLGLRLGHRHGGRAQLDELRRARPRGRADLDLARQGSACGEKTRALVRPPPRRCDLVASAAGRQRRCATWCAHSGLRAHALGHVCDKAALVLHRKRTSHICLAERWPRGMWQTSGVLGGCTVFGDRAALRERATEPPIVAACGAQRARSSASRHATLSPCTSRRDPRAREFCDPCCAKPETVRARGGKRAAAVVHRDRAAKYSDGSLRSRSLCGMLRCGLALVRRAGAQTRCCSCSW